MNATDAKISKLFFARYAESHDIIDARPEQVFAYIDDPARLSAHMTRSSWRMGGGRMRIEMDDGQGKRVGSHIRLRGTVLGIALQLEEVITEHEPPYRKAWETVDTRLLIIGAYRTEVEITTQGNRSSLEVSLLYSLPRETLGRWLGYCFADYYAAWCARRIVEDTKAHFATDRHDEP